VGKPFVTGAVVKGKVMGEVKGEKVIHYRYKKRKMHHKKRGHRQTYSQVEITAIGG
jgi:large subunit ribosomal protein L21